MSNSEKDMEQLFKGKFDDFEPESSKDLWPEIEAKLPRKKRRVIFIILLFAGLATAVIGLYKTSSFSLNKQLVVNGDSETQKSESHFPENLRENPIMNNQAVDGQLLEESQKEEKVIIPQGNNKIDLSKEVKDNRTLIPQGKNEGENSEITKMNKTNESLNSQETLEDDRLAAQGVRIENNSTGLTYFLNQLEEKREIVEEIKIPQGEKGLKPENIDTNESKASSLAQSGKKNGSDEVKVEAPTNSKYFWLGFGVQSGIYGNTVKSPDDAVQSTLVNKQDYENNKNLRRKIESPGIHWSFGLNMGYNFNKNWAIGSGFKVSQGYTKLSYNLIRNNNDRFESTTRIDPQYSGTPAFNPSDYVNGGDSIVAGSDFTHENRYFGREIPLFVQYTSGNESQKIRFIGELGLTFNVLRYVSAYYADLDNVGFVSVQGKDAFPGFRSYFGVNTSLGVQIKLKDDLNLNVVSSFSRAITSQTKYERWFKEYPFTAGISFRLIKTF